MERTIEIVRNSYGVRNNKRMGKTKYTLHRMDCGKLVSSTQYIGKEYAKEAAQAWVANAEVVTNGEKVW